MHLLLKRGIPALLMFSFVFTGILQAQTKEEAKVAETVEKLKEAMLSGDRAALESLVSDKLSYGHSSGVLDDKKQFVEKLASGQSDFETLELKDQWISVSGTTAIVRHELHAKTKDGGKAGEAHLRVILVFQNIKGKWLLLARQAVRIT